MKRLVMVSGLIHLLLASVLLASCSGGGVDALLGEYALKPGGQAELKISKSGDQYVASVRRGGAGWSSPDNLVACSEADYAQLFGSGWKEVEPLGLRATNGPFGIFRVKKGATAQGHTFKTGYFMFFMGGGDVYKL